MADKPSSLAHFNKVLKQAEARAWELESKLAGIIEPILVEAGNMAARNFERMATNHLTAALQERERWLIASDPDPRGLARSLALTSAGNNGVSRWSTMIALKPRPDEAERLAHPDGLDPSTLHITLASLGQYKGDLDVLRDALIGVAGSHAPLEGQVAGKGEFADNGNGAPVILLPSVPGLVELRVEVTEALVRAGIDYATNFGYQPHLTVMYTGDGLTAPDSAPLGEDLHFDSLLIVRGDVDTIDLPLTGSKPITAAVLCEIFGIDLNHWSSWHDLGMLASGEVPDWTAPAGDEVLDVPALVASLRTKTDPVRMAVVESTMNPSLNGVGIEYDVTNPFTAKVLAQSGSQIVGIGETTQLNVMRIVKESYQEGLSIPDTAKAIRVGMTEAAGTRATLIARTELAGAVNGGSLAATQIFSDASGIGYQKQWLTSPGAQYPRHEEYEGLDGQIAETLDGVFDVGGAQLQFPGDPDGPPEEVCNCRCTMVYLEAGQDVGETDADQGAGDIPTDMGGVGEALGSPDIGGLAATVDALDSTIAAAPPVPENLTVFRGTVTGEVNPDIGKGGVIKYGTYVSTTTERAIADDFAGGAPVLRVNVPEGTDALWMPKAATGSRAGIERELTLPRDTRLVVTGTEVVDGRTVIDVTVWKDGEALPTRATVGATGENAEKILDGAYEGLKLTPQQQAAVDRWSSLTGHSDINDHLLGRQPTAPSAPPVAHDLSAERAVGAAPEADRPFEHYAPATLKTQIYRSKVTLRELLAKDSLTPVEQAEYAKHTDRLSKLIDEKRFRERGPGRPFAHYAPATLKTQIYRATKTIKEIRAKTPPVSEADLAALRNAEAKLIGLERERQLRGIEETVDGKTVTARTPKAPVERAPVVPPPPTVLSSADYDLTTRTGRLKYAYAKSYGGTTARDEYTTNLSRQIGRDDPRYWESQDGTWEADLNAIGNDFMDEVNARLTDAGASPYDVAKRRGAILKLLNEIRPMGNSPDTTMGAAAKTKADADLVSMADTASAMYPRDWIQVAVRQGKGVEYNWAPPTGKWANRGFFGAHGGRGGKHQIQVSRGKDQVLQSDRPGFSTMVHEWGHLMENTVPALRAAEEQFYARRTYGEQLKRIYYGKEEWGREDQFVNHYIGKDYQLSYHEKKLNAMQLEDSASELPGRENSFEVLSMGMEGVMNGMYSMWTRDLDMCRTILGMLVAI